MANSLLTSTIVTREALRVLHQRLRFVGSIDRQYDDKFAIEGAKIGTTLNVRKPARYLATQGATLVKQDTSESFVPLTVNNQTHVGMNFSSVDLTMTIDDFSKRIISPAMATLAASIEANVLATLRPQVFQQVDNQGSAATLRTIALARKKLEDSLAPDDGDRTALINTQDNVDLVDGLKGLFNPQTNIAKNYRDGMMGNAIGFDFCETTHVTPQSRGSAAGYLVNGAGQLGSSLAVNTGTGTLNVGDIITIAGVTRVHPETKVDTGTPHQFVVTAPYAGGAGSVAIAPAITTAGAYQNVAVGPANGAAITVSGNPNTAYGQSLFYHKDAFTFATADLVRPNGVDWGARENFDGISVRIVRQYDINFDVLPCRVDVLWGCAALRPELATRAANN